MECGFIPYQKKKPWVSLNGGVFRMNGGLVDHRPTGKSAESLDLDQQKKLEHKYEKIYETVGKYTDICIYIYIHIYIYVYIYMYVCIYVYIL